MDIHDYPSIKPDAGVARAVRDPIEGIAEAMQERGFGTLFTTCPNATKFTDRVKKEFLRVYATTGRMAYSAACVGLSRCLINKTQRNDPVFKAACEEAQAYFCDLLQGEMYRRGVQGYKKQVVGGKDRDQVIELTEYSDRNMELLAKIHMPVLQKKQVEIKGTVDNSQTLNITNTAFDLSSMPPADLAMFKQLLQNQATRAADEAADQAAIEGEVGPNDS